MDILTETLAKKFSLTLEEEEGVVVEQSDTGARALENHHKLVGRVVSSREISFHSIKLNTLRLLAPVKGCNIQSIGPNKILLQFEHTLDKKHALEGCLWVLERHALIFRELADDEIASEVAVNFMNIVVRIYQIPASHRSAETARLVASKIGTVIQVVNDKQLDTIDYIRIKVSFDVTQRLKRGTFLLMAEGAKVWAEFKYERLPSFCFLCGMLGHGETKCPTRYEVDFTDPGENLSYGMWMKAPSSRDGDYPRSPLQPIQANLLNNIKRHNNSARGKDIFEFTSQQNGIEAHSRGYSTPQYLHVISS